MKTLRLDSAVRGRRPLAGSGGRLVLYSLLIVLPLVFASCAPPPEKRKYDLQWPLPPDEPKVKFVDMYETSLDVVKQTGAADVIFGAEQAMNFVKPYGIVSDGAGKVYVSDVGGVVMFDLVNKAFTTIGTDPGVGQLKVPLGLALSSDGRLFVSDVAADKVMIYKNGNFQTSFGDKREFESPSGLAVDEKRGLIYVLDAKMHRISVHSLSTYKLLKTIGKRGEGDGEFNYPTNIALDDKGTIYVVDTGNYRIQTIDPDGTFVKVFGQAGDTPGALGRPKGIAVDSEGHLYVADAAFGNFQIFDKDGKILLFVGEAGSGPGKFQLPAGLAIDKNDMIYVVDQLPGSFQVFQYMSEKWKRAQEKADQGQGKK
ncbi:MAG: 6-bladed beta-propeller [Nitrospirae bacterium]|nr:6-bladed beta-propeller [Nitrospirota bacterium]